MGFWGDFGGRAEDIWWETTSVLTIAHFQFFGPDLTRRAVAFCMGIAICHRRKFGKFGGPLQRMTSSVSGLRTWRRARVWKLQAFATFLA